MALRKINFIGLIILINTVFFPINTLSAIDQRIIDLSKASILIDKSKPSDALVIIDKYFENPVADDDNIWTARAYYLRGCCQWELGNKVSGLSDIEKGVSILLSIDRESYKIIPDFTNIIAGASVYSCNIGEYNKGVYYGELYHKTIYDLRNYNEYYQNQFLINLKILANCYDKIGKSYKIFEYTSRLTDIKCLSDENENLLISLMVLYADVAYKNSVWDVAIALYNLCLLQVQDKYGENDKAAYEIKLKLASVFNKVEKSNEAMEILQDLKPVADRSEDSDFKYSVYLEYISALQERGDKRAALDLMTDNLDALERLYDDEEHSYNIHFILYTLQKSNGLDGEATKTYHKYLQKTTPENKIYESVGIANLISDGKMEEAHKSIQNFKKRLELSGDTLSVDNERYLQLELMYSLASKQSASMEIADMYFTVSRLALCY